MTRWKLIFCLALVFACYVTTNRLAAEERVRVAISNFSASYISMHIGQKRGYYTEEGMICGCEFLRIRSGQAFPAKPLILTIPLLDKL